jgi:hypothetical protein
MIDKPETEKSEKQENCKPIPKVSPYDIANINLSEEFGLIKTDEIDDLFANDEMSLDDQQKQILKDLKSSEGSESQPQEQTVAVPDKIEFAKPDQVELGEPDSDPVPLQVFDDDEPVTKKSENPNRRKPNNKYDERLQEIINKNKSKVKDDLDEVEEQMLAIQNESSDLGFVKPLSERNDYSAEKSPKHDDFNDVDSEDLMNAMDSYEKDIDLSNDSKIPSMLPQLDPDLDFEKIDSAYFSNNQGLSKNGNGHSISQNIISKKYASIDKAKRIKESITKKSIKVKKDRLNYTMPKRFKFSDKESGHIMLEHHNSTIKIKSKGNFITPKRAEGHENDDLSQNYSQAPTPVPPYRYKNNMKQRDRKLSPHNIEPYRDRQHRK